LTGEKRKFVLKSTKCDKFKTEIIGNSPKIQHPERQDELLNRGRANEGFVKRPRLGETAGKEGLKGLYRDKPFDPGINLLIPVYTPRERGRVRENPLKWLPGRSKNLIGESVFTKLSLHLEILA
jgi:hypothetical protein